MPTYDYVCRACGHEFERFQPITAEAIRKCPECGKSKVERKIGIGAGVLFKGSGFYETDYRSEQYTKSAAAEKAAAQPKTETGDATMKEADKNKTPEKPAAEGSAKPPAKTPAKTANEPAPKLDLASKATHPSRIGRGMGNILNRNVTGKGPQGVKGKPGAPRRSRGRSR